MNVFRHLLVWILLLVAGGGGLFYILTTPGLKPVVIAPYAPQILKIDAGIQNLGTLSAGATKRHILRLYNVGGKPLLIQDVLTACNCAVVLPQVRQVLPGGFAVVKVNLTASQRPGPFKESLTVISNDPEHPQTEVFLTGTVR